MKNKNIAFYIPALYKGGSERVIITLADFFKKDGYNVKIVTDYKLENEYEVPDGVERIVLVDTDTEKLSGAKAIFRFRKFCKRNKIDTVVSFLNIYHALIATVFLSAKCVISIRNDPGRTYKTFSSKVKNRILLPLADGFVFQTQDAKDYFGYCSNGKSAIIANPIKDEFFEYEYKGCKNRIITMGRLTRQKNQKLLIEAFSEASREHKDWILEIYGDGELRRELSDLIRERELDNSVFLRGQTADVARIMSESTVFVLPSLYEGMPNALMEAMAVGLPCIATDCPCGGPKALLDNGCGILTDGTVDSLKNALTELMTDEALRIKYSSEARKKAEEFRKKDICSKWKAFLNEL